MKEARLYERLGGYATRCLTCERRCLIKPGERGFCKTRLNIDGKLYTLVYGDLNAISANPIEKKPFFHFYPGSLALTFSTHSCNFPCPWCQNWELSRSIPDPSRARFVPPSELLDLATLEGCQGLSVSFTEPLMLFEYSLDVFPMAKRLGLYNNYVSNGYMTLEALRMLIEAGMDAIKFDVKGDADAVRLFCNADVEIVWRNASEARRLGAHVEVVNLVIPDVNDDEACLSEIVERHLKTLGPEVPLHFTRYYPAYKFDKPPTPVKVLEKACEMARRMGAYYVYIGNVPGHKYENTYCPSCGEVLIKRYGLSVIQIRLREDLKCPNCEREIPIVGKAVVRKGIFW